MFDAKADMLKWLTYPSELGREPDELEEIDHRILKWPPSFDPIPVWLFRYRVIDPLGIEDDVDVGMVGSRTFCLALQQNSNRPPEDVYALHCMWELEIEEKVLIQELNEEEDIVEKYKQSCASNIQVERYSHIVLLFESLGMNQTIFAIAQGLRGEQRGFVVVDEIQSTWYPETDFPARIGFQSTYDVELILRIHVGRYVLGFKPEKNRQAWLNQGKISPVEYLGRVKQLLNVILNYQHFTKIFFDSFLFRSFWRYVNEKQKADNSISKSFAIVETYEEIQSSALEVDRRHNTDYFADRWSYHFFEEYVDALFELNNSERITHLIPLYRPHWQHNMGRNLLGRAAYRAGLIEEAKEILQELHDQGEDIWPHFVGTDDLARIYILKGKAVQAEQLLITAMKILDNKFQKASDSDVKLYNDFLVKRVETFFELFPEYSLEYLQSQGISVGIEE